MIKLINTFNSRLFLNIAFVISLASIFFTASITYKHIVDLNKSTKLVMKSYEVKLELEKLMSVLKDADLIRNEREGKFIYYELNATVLEEILLWISELKGGNDYDQTK